MLRPRVYSKTDKKVLEVVEIDFDYKLFVVRNIDNSGNNTVVTLSFSNAELMENTGFKDIDNKDIYVNDIVEFIYSLFPDPVIGIVNSDNQVVVNNVMYLDIQNLLTVSVKVVGNIYENKELLKNE